MPPTGFLSRDLIKGTIMRIYWYLKPYTLQGLKEPLLKGSWDLVTRVINRVTIRITTYNPN